MLIPEISIISQIAKIIESKTDQVSCLSIYYFTVMLNGMQAWEYVNPDPHSSSSQSVCGHFYLTSKASSICKRESVAFKLSDYQENTLHIIKEINSNYHRRE
jgi:hypothetical protein